MENEATGSSIEGIFKKDFNHWTITIKTGEGTLEKMNVTSPFPVEIFRLKNEDDTAPWNKIGIEFDLKEDSNKIEFSKFTIAKEISIEESQKKDSGLIVMKIDN